MITKKIVSGILLILLQCAMISSISIVTATFEAFSKSYTPIQSEFHFGDTINFTIKLRVLQNSGPPLSISNLTITDPLPVGETFVTGSNTSTPSSSFTAYPNGTLFWDFGGGPFRTDPQAVVSYNITVTAGASGRIYNRVAAAYTETVSGVRSVPRVTDSIYVVAPGQRKLTVSSAHDSPSPSNGDSFWSDGQSVTCSVSSPVTEGGTVWTCTGWSGTGSVPESGTGKTVTFAITQDSSITWSWSGPAARGSYAVLIVKAEVGSLHFKGETAEFTILTSDLGKLVNETSLKSKLYYNGTLINDLNGAIEPVDTGFYRIPYNIPSDAQPGEYTLWVEAEYYGASSATIAKFNISPTLTAWNEQIAQITAIQDGVATINNGVTNLSLNLAAINATLTGLIVNDGQVMASISTTVGTLSTKLDTINAKFGDINGNIVTISSALGNITTKLDGIQSTATTTMYAAAVLSAIAIILAVAILVFARKK